MEFAKTCAAILALGALAVSSASAAPRPPDSSRYVFERVAGGFARMDKASGEVSYCRMESGALVCRLAADDRKAYESQIHGLAQENADLRARLGIASGAPTGSHALTQKKAEAGDEIDLVAYIMKRMIHALRDVADEAEQLRADPPPAQ